MESMQNFETEDQANISESGKANAQLAIIPIENPRWSEKPPFDDIPENLRDEIAKKYNMYERLLDVIDSRFFVSYCGGKSLIYRIPEDMNGELQQFSHNEFRNHYGNKTIPIVTDIKKGELIIKKAKYFMDWMKHKNRRQ
jgi:hypothetical protein